MKCEYEQKQFIVLHSSIILLYWKKLKIGILIMRVKITKSYTVILENWYLQLLIQYLLKEKVIDKCFCGFGWCPLLVTWCDHIHHTSTRSPELAPAVKIHQRKWKKKKKPTTYRTSREESHHVIANYWHGVSGSHFGVFFVLLSRSESYGNSYVFEQ